MNVYLAFSFALGGAYLTLMALYCYGFWKPRKKTSKVQSTIQPFFSVIIPARNEQANIVACLKSILSNDYPESNFEIILIDDFSEDNTVALASNILKAPHQILQLSKFLSQSERLNAYKKKALEIGIAQAKGTHIVTTDADCIVLSTWLQTLAQQIQQNPSIQCLAAPVNLTPVEGQKKWIYYFQSIDFMTMQGITIASNRLNLGNMSNGANFLFSKQAYDAVDGYRDIDHKASGDDMMLMQKINNAFPNSIDYVFDEKAIVNTPAQADWSSFINQRIRWASKADSYPQFKMTLTLLLVYLFNFNFLILTISAFFSHTIVQALFLLLLLKILSELVFVISLSNFFNKRKELIFLIFLQPLHIAYIISAGFLGKFGNYTWKGRAVH